MRQNLSQLSKRDKLRQISDNIMMTKRMKRKNNFFHLSKRSMKFLTMIKHLLPQGHSISDTEQPDDVVGIPGQRTIRFMRLKSS